MSTPDELIAQAESGEIYRRVETDRPSMYEPGDPVCVLTLDQKQAWLIMVLFGEYKDCTPEQWDFYRAAWDVRRRVAEAMGYE